MKRSAKRKAEEKQHKAAASYDDIGKPMRAYNETRQDAKDGIKQRREAELSARKKSIEYGKK